MSRWWVRLPGLLLLAVVLGCLAAGAVLDAQGRAELAAAGPACIFRWATDLPCCFCGMTRATLALGAGDVGSALHFHPLSPLVIAVSIWAAVALLRDRRPTAFGRPLPAALILVAVFATWTVNLVHHLAS